MENNNTQKFKENDMFLSLLFNPTYGTSDFVMEGMDSGNTSIQSFDAYKDNDKIREMFKDKDGNVDEEAMKRAYNISAMMYNDMSNMETEDLIIKGIEYDPDSFVRPFDAGTKDIEKMNRIIEFGKDTPIINPDRKRMNMTAIGEIREGLWTPRELAQMHQRYNPRTGKFEASPETWFGSSFFDMFDTTVMATYDENDPEVLSGEKEAREYKLNDDGSYYTEFLNGRNIYNKEIVSRWDTLTREGSWLNRYDPFDSDDKEKSVFGSLVRNTIEVVPMFVKSISPYYLGASIGMQMVQLGSVMTKWIDGDNEIANSIDGFVSSFNMGTSEYSRKKAFTMENMLNMAGDVWRQLKEQRWIFKNAARLRGGKNVIDNEEEVYKMLQKQYRDKGLDKDTLFKYMSKVSKGKNVPDLDEVMKLNERAYIQGQMEKYIKQSNKLGRELGILYMTGITSVDMWNVAKRENATDEEATFLMLGYMLGEYGILKSYLGQMVMPELRAERKRIQHAVNLASGATDEFVNAGKTEAAKSKYVSTLLKYGRDIFNGSYHGNKDTIAALGANALGEGFEETAEELWVDVSKNVANVINEFAFSGTQYKPFENVKERYGMSFLGGAMGGGLFNATETFKAFNEIHSDINTPDAAYGMLVNMINNGEAKTIKDVVSKMTFYDNNLSSTSLIGADEDMGFAPKKKGEKSLNDEAKDRIYRVIDNIELMLKENRLNIPDDSVLSINAIDMLKHYAIKNSITSSLFLQNANTATVNLIKAIKEKDDFIRDILTNGDNTKNITDKDVRAYRDLSNLTKEQTGKLEELDRNIENARVEAQSYVNGMKSNQYVDMMLFELTDDLNNSYRASSVERYAEALYGKKIGDLSETEINNAGEELAKFRLSKGKEYLDKSYRTFQYMLGMSNGILSKNSSDWYLQEQSLKDIQNVISNVSKKAEMMHRFIEDEKKFYLFAENEASINHAIAPGPGAGNDILINSEYSSEFRDILAEEIEYVGGTVDKESKTALLDGLNSITQDQRDYVYKKVRSRIADLIINDIYNQVSSYSKQKFINPVIKNELMKMISTFNEIAKRDNSDSDVDNNYMKQILDVFSISSDLFESAEKIINDNDLSLVQKSKSLLKLIDETELSANDFTEDEISAINSVEEKLLDYIESPRAEFKDKYYEINKLAEVIQSKSNTPIGDFLDSFGLSIDGKKASEVINELENKFNDFSGNMGEFSITEDDKKRIELINELAIHAQNILNAYRKDTLSYGNLFGYAAMKNKIFEKDPNYKPLEIIDERYAELVSNELSSVIGRLSMYYNLDEMNSKNQLTRDFKLDARKQALFYKGVKDTIVPILKEIGVDSTPIENALNDNVNDKIKEEAYKESPSYDFSDEQKIKNMKGFKLIRNAIHEVFADLDDSQLKMFASKMRFASNTDMSFNSSSTSFSNSVLYWQIASIVAVNPDVIDALMKNGYNGSNIAPVSNQTMSTSMTLSYILGGDKLKQFAQARRDSINSQIDEAIAAIDDIDVSSFVMLGNSREEVIENFTKFLASSNGGSKIINMCDDFESIGLKPFILDVISAKKDPSKSYLVENWKDKLKFLVQNSQYYTKFPATTMIEGVPGSGKTFGVLVSTNNSLLAKKDGKYAIKGIESLMRDVWVVSNESNKESITNLVKKSLGELSGNVTGMTHDELIKKAFGNSFDNKIGVYNGKDGTDGKMYVDSSNGDYTIKYDYNTTFDDSNNAPSYIIIDEATLLSYPKLKAINDIAEKYGTKVIMIGDSEQVSDILNGNGIFDVKTKKKITPQMKNSYFPIITEMNSFIMAPKMGESMRYDNVQHKVNVDNSRKGVRLLKYALDDSGFYGDAWFSGMSDDSPEIKNIIDKMFSSLDKNKNEKVMIIGDGNLPSNKRVVDYLVAKRYISLDDNGKIVNSNQAEHYEDALTFETAMDSQGREAMYVIYLNGKDTDKNITSAGNMRRSIYTGMSRSKRGTLMIEDAFIFNGQTKDNSPIISTYNEKSIKDFTEKYISIMNEADENMEIPEFSYGDSYRDNKKDKKQQQNKQFTYKPVAGAGNYFRVFPNGVMNKKDGEPEVVLLNGGLFKDSKVERKGANKSDEGKEDTFKSNELDDKIDEANDTGGVADGFFAYGYTSTMYEKGNYFYGSKEKDQYVSCIDGINDSLNGSINIVYMVMNKEKSPKAITVEDKMNNNGRPFLENIAIRNGQKQPFKSIKLNLSDGAFKVGYDEYVKNAEILVSKLHTAVLMKNDDRRISFIKSAISEFVYNTINEDSIDTQMLDNILDSISMSVGMKFMQDNPNKLNFKNNDKYMLAPFIIDNSNEILYDSESGRDEKYSPKNITKKIVTRIKCKIGNSELAFMEIPTTVINNPITMYSYEKSFLALKEYSKLDEEILSSFIERTNDKNDVKLNALSPEDVAKLFEKWENDGITPAPPSSNNIRSAAYDEYIAFKNMVMMYKWRSLSYSELDINEFETTSPYVTSVDKGYDDYYGVDTLSYIPEMTEVSKLINNGSSMSYILSAKTANNDLGIDPGIPFVIYSSVPGLSTDELYESMRNVATGKVKPSAETPSIILLRNPRVKIEVFMNKLYNIISKKFDNKNEFDKAVGNDLTVFNILKEIIGSDSSYETFLRYVNEDTNKHVSNMMSEIVNYGDESMTRIDAFRFIVDKYTNKSNNEIDYDRLINDLRKNNENVRNLLNDILYRMITNGNSTLVSDSNLEIDEAHVSDISRYLQMNGYSGINMSIKITGNKIGNGIYRINNNDEGDGMHGIYDNEGVLHEFLAYLKIDRPIVLLDENQFSNIMKNTKLTTINDMNDVVIYNKSQFSSEKFDEEVNNIKMFNETNEDQDGNKDDVRSDEQKYEVPSSDPTVIKYILEEYRNSTGKDFDGSSKISEDVVNSSIMKMARDGKIMYYDNGYKFIDISNNELYKEFAKFTELNRDTFLNFSKNGISNNSNIQIILSNNNGDYDVVLEIDHGSPRFTSKLKEVKKVVEQLDNSNEESMDKFYNEYINSDVVDGKEREQRVNDAIIQLSARTGITFDESFIEVLNNIISNSLYIKGKGIAVSSNSSDEVEMMRMMFDDEINAIKKYVEGSKEDDNTYLLAKFVSNISEDNSDISCITI